MLAQRATRFRDLLDQAGDHPGRSYVCSTRLLPVEVRGRCAAQLWEDGDWLFATPTGGPVNPRTDYDEWKRLLKLAGLRDGRLHDARHTAATSAGCCGRSRQRAMKRRLEPN